MSMRQYIATALFVALGVAACTAGDNDPQWQSKQADVFSFNLAEECETRSEEWGDVTFEVAGCMPDSPEASLTAWKTALKAATCEATRRLDRAIASLEALDAATDARGNLLPEADEESLGALVNGDPLPAQEALVANFSHYVGRYSAIERNRILRLLLSVREHMAGRTTHRFQCRSKRWITCWRDAPASAFPSLHRIVSNDASETPTVTICPPYWGESESTRARLVVHEWLHRYGVFAEPGLHGIWLDVGYGSFSHGYKDFETRRPIVLSNKRLYVNADTVSNYVMRPQIKPYCFYKNVAPLELDGNVALPSGERQPPLNPNACVADRLPRGDGTEGSGIHPLPVPAVAR